MTFFLLLTTLLFFISFSSPPKSLKTSKSVGFTVESAEYDETLDIYWLSDDDNNQIRAFQPSSPQNELSNLTLYDTGFNSFNNYSFTNGTMLSFPLGLFKHPTNDLLYVCSSDTSYILAFNTTNKDIKYAKYLGDNQTPNGICYNPTTERLYVTDVGMNLDDYSLNGLQQVWELQLPELTLLRKFLGPTDDIYPNGCTINNNIMYTTTTYFGNKTNILNSQGILIWRGINNSSTSIGPFADFDKYNYMSDGIIFDKKNNMYVSSWGNGSNGQAFISSININSQNNIDKGFRLYFDGLTSAADLGYDTKRDIILIPSMNLGQLELLNSFAGMSSSDDNDGVTGEIWFVVLIVICGVLFIFCSISMFYFRYKICFCCFNNDDKEDERRGSQYQALNTGNEEL